MQKINTKCTECGGDGLREPMGGMEVPGKCTHCKGTGREPDLVEALDRIESQNRTAAFEASKSWWDRPA